jgi:hypothetical protein
MPELSYYDPADSAERFACGLSTPIYDLLMDVGDLTAGPGRLFPEIYLRDAQESVGNDSQRGAIIFPAGQDSWAWNQLEFWRGGVQWRLVCEVMTTTADDTSLDWRIAYLVVPTGGANPVVKNRWRANSAYAVGDMVIPLGTELNGYYYLCTTTGTSGTTQPTWATCDQASTNDGGVVWTCQTAGFKPLALSVTPPATAYQRFIIDDPGLVIPQAECAAWSRVHLGVWRQGTVDGNTSDLLLVNARLVPVEV